jgi:hypothetical protein
MKNLHTLKLTASSIGSQAPRSVEPAETIAAAPTQEIRVEQPAPAARAPRPQDTGLRKRLVALAAVAFAATLAAVAAQGSIHSPIFRIAAAALALTVALVVAIEAAASARRRSPAAAPARATAAPSAKQFSKSKLVLLFIMAAGFATYFGGGGSFASFTAQDTNPNSNIASGTLTMSNTVNNRTTACFSYNGVYDNTNPSCDATFSLTGTGTPNSAPGASANPTGAGNLAPGAAGAVAKLTVENTGSIDASTLKLLAPDVSATLHTNAIPTGVFTTITINNLEGKISSGDHLTISSGSQSVTVQASGSYSPVSPITTDITVTVTGGNNATGSAIPVGASVDDTDANTGSTNTDCYDQKATTNQVSGATVGSTLTFNTGATTNTLCNTALLYVQEVGSGHNYCWFGVIDGASNAVANGMCAAPISTNPSAFVGSANSFSPSTTYTVTALTGNVKAGETVTMTQGNNAVTCTNANNQFMGDTSITTTAAACTVIGVNGAFSSSAVITDPSTLTLLNPGNPSLSADTIGSFDTSKHGTNGVVLYPVSSNGNDVVGAPVSLPKYDSSSHTSARTFYVGVFLPSGNGSDQNNIQGLMSTFGISWYIGS